MHLRAATDTQMCVSAAQSKAWVCGRSLAGIAGSNPAWDMDVCLLCVVRRMSLRWTDPSSRRVLPVCLRVCH